MMVVSGWTVSVTDKLNNTNTVTELIEKAMMDSTSLVVFSSSVAYSYTYSQTVQLMQSYYQWGFSL